MPDVFSSPTCAIWRISTCPCAISVAGIVDERHGELGEIREVIETAAHDVWVIDGPHGEVLVPVVDEVIVAYPDDDDGVIRTRVMDGLLES